MRAIVIYKENTDYTRTVLEYLRDFEHQTGHILEIINPETPDGIHFCETYGILEFPTIIAISDDGIMQNQWTNLPLPTINEVSFYVQND